MHTIVLYEPEIPQNTGNIIRTCSATFCDLILIEPLGFKVTDKYLKRASLDYFLSVNVTVMPDFETYVKSVDAPFYFFSSKGAKRYTDVAYEEGCHFIFGSESKGLPQSLHDTYKERVLRIPMNEKSRCLNVSTAAGVVLYEALRQREFKELL